MGFQCPFRHLIASGVLEAGSLRAAGWHDEAYYRSKSGISQLRNSASDTTTGRNRIRGNYRSTGHFECNRDITTVEAIEPCRTP